MKTVGYIRVSTVMQVRDGYSLAEQEQRLTRYAEANELELVGIERDEGLSAKNIDRPGLQRVLELLDTKKAQAILVTKLDRFTRNLRELLELVDVYFKDGKFHLISIHEKVDTSSALGRFFLNLMGAVNQLEREQTSERVATIMQYKRQRQEYTGGLVPFGYKVSDGSDSKVLVKVSREQRIMEVVTRRRLDGWSFRDIALELNKLGFRRRGGTRFEQKAVWRMWKRVEEFGLFELGKKTEDVQEADPRSHQGDGL